MVLYKKARSKLCPTGTILDYVDDLALLANRPSQAESQLHSLEQAAGYIGPCVNANRTKFMCLKREEAILL